VPTDTIEPSLIGQPTTLFASPQKEYLYKVAVFTDMPEFEPEAISLLEAEKEYGERIVRYTAFYDPEISLGPGKDAIINEALPFILDPKIKVLLFIVAGNIYEPVDILKAFKEARPDIFYIALYCYPWSDAYGVDDNLMEFADLELSIDQAITAKKAVEQAKKMGATTCIYYTTRDHRYYDIDIELYRESYILPEIRDIIKTGCTLQNMEYVEVITRDVMSDSLEGEDFNSYSVCREIPKYGQDICVFSSKCYIDMIITNDGLTYKTIVIQLCHPSLFHKGGNCAAHFTLKHIDSKNHFGDLEWTIEEAKSNLKEQSLSGRYATWRVPFTMAATTAAVEYAIGYCEGEIESKTDLSAMRECFQKAMGIYNSADTGFELNQHSKYPNCFMFTEDYIVLSAKE
jgi:hypothetical protein